MKERSFTGTWFTDASGVDIQGAGALHVVVVEDGRVALHVGPAAAPLAAIELAPAAARELARWLARELA